MLNDIRNRFSNAQAITSGTITSTDTVDTQVAQDLGAGNPIQVVVTPVGLFAGGTSLIIVLQGSNDADPATFGSPVEIARTRSYTLAELNATAGSVFANRQDIVLPIPPLEDETGFRSYRLQYVCTGTFSGASAFTAYVASVGDANNKAYPGGYTYQS